MGEATLDAGALKDAGADDAGADDAGADDAGADDAGAEDAGAADAGAEDAGAPCLDGEQEDCDLSESCQGLRRCVDGEWTACEAPEEICDGIDNDCDGAIDDVVGLGNECSVGQGECAASGVTVCDVESGALVCGAVASAPGTEVCDGLDNDCDGHVDNVAGLGESCSVGVGECAATGQHVCDVEGGALVCDAVPSAPSTEVCDGLDNDCDDHVDNVAGVGDSCWVGMGECEASGEQVCDVEGGALVCDAVPFAPSSEVCDGNDNNCDGRVDDVAGVGDSCSVGRGECARTGLLVCGVTGADPVCSAAPGSPADEICNGLDDDCDGDIDNVVVNLVEGNGYASDRFCTSMEIGDLNGDGRVDVVCAPGPAGAEEPLDTRLFIYLNQGQGNFAPASYLSPVAAPFRAQSGLALGDVDGDGDLDIVAVGETMRAQVYRNDGSGGFAAPFEAFPFTVSGEPGTGGIALVDIDDDGDLDVVTSIGTVRAEGWTIVYSLNNGSGVFGAPQPIGSNSARAMAIRSVNLDGDGDADVVVVYEEKVEFYRATAPGAFEPATVVSTAVTGLVGDALLADVDADGFPDLVLPASAVRYYVPGVSGGFGALRQVALDFTEVSAAAGAFDCDAGLEVVLVSANGGAPLAYMGAPETLSATPVVPDMAGSAVRVFDVDQDGDADVVVGALAGGIRVLQRQ